MAHESRLFVVKGNDSSWYGEKVAMFDLCSVPSCYDKFRTYPATKLEVYLENGDFRTTEDKYGEPIREIPLKDAIEIIENASAYDNYRRFGPCLALLKSFDEMQWGELVVLHYGY